MLVLLCNLYGERSDTRKCLARKEIAAYQKRKNQDTACCVNLSRMYDRKCSIIYTIINNVVQP